MNIKEPKTYDEQLDILISRGCEISERNAAINMLKRTNYYRLSAYFLPFKLQDGTYQSGTSLENVYGIYEFDKRITVLLCGLIEEIEVFIKCQIAYYHSIKYGALGYLYEENFLPSKAEKHRELMAIFQKEVANNKDTPCVKHHMLKYDGKFPFWAAVELFTLGNISQFYSQMTAADKKSVCIEISNMTGYTYTYAQMESLLFCLTHLRNKCAHFSRLYYYKFGTIPKFPAYVLQNTSVNAQNLHIYQYLYVLKLLTPVPERWTSFITELEALIDTYSEKIERHHIGFPSDWKQELSLNFD